MVYKLLVCSTFSLQLPLRDVLLDKTVHAPRLLRGSCCWWIFYAVALQMPLQLMLFLVFRVFSRLTKCFSRFDQGRRGVLVFFLHCRGLGDGF